MHDLTAGVTVGFVALPLAMAFSIASGLSPEAGLYCAVVAGFLVSALGGSSCQIGGPTGAFVVVVAGIVAKYGIDGLFMCTLMAGVLLMLLGITGMGTVIQFIPRPVVIGFTNGIAVLIASTQIKDFFGIDLDKVPGEFLHRMQALGEHWSTLDPVATGVAACVARVHRRHAPDQQPHSRHGSGAVRRDGDRLDRGPSDRDHREPLRRDSRGVAAPASAAIPARPDPEAAVAGHYRGHARRHRVPAVGGGCGPHERRPPQPERRVDRAGDREHLLTTGGGLPATGAIARTATNIRAGAKTPVAGMIHALTLLLIVLLAGPLAKHIPLAVLAAILLTVAYNMGEWQEIPDIVRLGRPATLVWLTTFALTVLADLTVAVEAGMILAVLLFIRAVTTTTTVTRDHRARHRRRPEAQPAAAGIPPRRRHLPDPRAFPVRLGGETQVIEREIDSLPPVVILRLRNMTAIDATGLHALESISERLRKAGRHVILCGRSRAAAPDDGSRRLQGTFRRQEHLQTRERSAPARQRVGDRCVVRSTGARW